MAKKKTTAPDTGTTTLAFGCLGGVCVPSNPPYPLHLGPPGNQVYMCALNTDVDIKFTNSPFVSGNKHFSIAKGTCAGPETVATVDPDKKFKFTLKCLAGCPTPAGGPEMIVP